MCPQYKQCWWKFRLGSGLLVLDMCYKFTCQENKNYIWSVLKVLELSIKQALVTNAITQHYRRMFNNKITYFWSYLHH